MNNKTNTPKGNDELSLDNKKEEIINLENHSVEEKLISNSHPKKHAENAVPPEAWKNQEKAYEDEWENNKNRMLDDDL